MTSAPSYPRKLFYRIQEAADILEVEPYVLRYWETKFPMLSPDKDANDQRRYRQRDIDLLLRIRELLYVEKYTIAGAVERLKDELGGRRSAAIAAPPPPAPEPVAETPGPVAVPPVLDEDRLDKIQRVRDELGLLRRELEDWRDELGG
jgi:DNA-binding transcriptional MerR regulator